MRAVILHGHIFKNAGSTLDWSLQRSFGEAFLDHRNDSAMTIEGEQYLCALLAAQPQLCALSSHHLCCPLPQLDTMQLLPLFMLRHPISRVASVYAFERQQGGTSPGAVAAREMSFEDYVGWRLRPSVARTIRNYQTLYLAGRHRDLSSAQLGLGIFGRAMATVRSVPTIGLVERYDESMVLFEAALRPYFPQIDLSYVRQNQTAAPDLPRTPDAILQALGAAGAELVDANSLDLAIYQLVQQRFAQTWSEWDVAEQELESFRRRCEALQE